MAAPTWTAVLQLPLPSLSGEAVTFGQLAPSTQARVRDSFAIGVGLAEVAADWSEADLAVAIARNGQAWDVRVSWSPPAA